MNHFYPALLSCIVSLSLFFSTLPLKGTEKYPSSFLQSKTTPNNSLNVNVSPSEVCLGESTLVSLSSSESGVNYQLVLEGKPVGTPIAGTGSILEFQIKPENTCSYQILATHTSTLENSMLLQTANVTVNPGPDLDLTIFSDHTQICESLNTPVVVSILDSENGLTYWLKNDAGEIQSSTIGNGGLINFSTVSPGVTTTYYAETTMTGCSGNVNIENSFQLEVIPLPLRDIDLHITEPQICIGEKTIISMDTSQIGVSYQLYNGTYLGENSVAGTGAPLEFPEFSPFRSVDYQVIAKNNACGTSVALNQSIKVLVGLQPEDHLHPTIDKHTICQGEEIIVSLTPTDPSVEYQLFEENTPIGSPLTGNSEDLHFAPTTPSASTTYRIEALGDKCLHPIDIRYTVDVDVHQIPSVQKDLFVNQNTICKGEEVIFSIPESEDGVFYQLYDGSNFIEPNIIGNGAKIEFPPQTPQYSTQYQAFAHKSVCDEKIALNDQKSIKVLNILPLSLESFVTPDDICQGNLVDIELPNSISGVEYVLKDSNNELERIIGDGGSVLFENVRPDSNSDFNIGIGSCADELVAAKPEFTYHPNPKLQILSKDITNGSDGEIVIAVSEGCAPYTYIVNPGETITTSSSVLEIGNLKPDTYQILVVDGNACHSSEAGHLVELEFNNLKVSVTNALTPNGDGINDEWLIYCAPELGNPEVYIFNIYGQEIYHSKAYQNNWKGTYNGAYLPNGAYYYLIEFKSNDAKPIKGTLSILGNY